ncbi:hypothetical protein FRB94_011036 [Tulasnella sp. JGI-2019a]|nr:hypothetical protein FRB93_000607 [Tulasnella sp. JGI-2019a]KAG9010059.1 hypothetical protein FRB94_011036 [Tulasnella sp. JGI-2019a]KAG9029279.1 hypothetical protein FRB95_005501 [Tulasnella sp. JGI-2019a]
MSSSRLQVAAVVSFYMVAALVMVFVNKAVLNTTPDLPLSFLFIQLSIAVVLLHIASWIVPNKVVLPKPDLDVAYKLLPCVLVNVIGLVFNTLCLRAVDASFFQIARGLVLPLTIGVSSAVTHSRPSRAVIVAAAIVTAGFFVGVSPGAIFSSSTSSAASTTHASRSIDATILALAYGVMSSLMIALHAVLIKSAHEYVDNSSIKLAYWTNLVSAVMLLPFVFFTGELDKLMAPRLAEEWEVFVIGSAITGFFGFLLCMAGLLSIKVTSPVTHMFSSAARSVIQTVLGVMIFGDIISANRGLSILIITLGTLYYTWIKSSGGPPRGAVALPPSPKTAHDMEKQALAKSES